MLETPAGTLQPTVRIGLSTSGAELDSFEILYHRADSDLYLAKELGRNQVVA